MYRRAHRIERDGGSKGGSRGMWEVVSQAIRIFSFTEEGEGKIRLVIIATLLGKLATPSLKF